jgi:hypothetical protein
VVTHLKLLYLQTAERLARRGWVTYLFVVAVVALVCSIVAFETLVTHTQEAKFGRLGSAIQ